MLRHPEYQYLDIMAHLLEKGDRRMDRTGEGTLWMFARLLVSRLRIAR
jgi:thymidylate synthase